MVTRRSLAILSAITLVLFAISGLLGKGQHGLVRAISFTSWWGFVACAVLLIGASIAAVVRHRRRTSRT
jgi:hypothetical protein